MNDDGPPTRSPLRVNVVDAQGHPVPAATLARWLASVAPGRARGTVTIALVSDARIRALNRQFRGRDYATDVLSFPSRNPLENSTPARHRTASGRRRPAPRSRPATAVLPATDHLGDIVIARGVARRQARAAGHDERIEWRVLALHGLLHLLGYDHDTDNGRMARMETRLRRAGGLTGGLIEREGRR